MSGKGVCGGGLAADGTEGIANQPTYTHVRTYTGKERETRNKVKTYGEELER